MLGQLKEHTASGWGIVLMILLACLLLLAAVSLFVRATGSMLNFNLLEQRVQPQTDTGSIAQPAVDVLRAAKPDNSGGAVPESTMAEQLVAVEVLRAAKPDFAAGFVPESTIGEQVVSVEALRAAKPDFTGGYVPESTIGEQR